LFSGQENQSGNADYQIVDGIMAWVIGPPLAINNWDYAGNRWVSGTNWGGSALFGSLDLGSNFLVDSGLLSGDDGSISATDYIPILMDWQDDVDILANGYAGKAYVYRRDLGYAFAGIGETPFTVWETDWETMTQKVRQLNVCFTEDVRYADPNFIWDMGAAGLGNAFPDEEGAREYMFIMNTTYDLANGVGTTYDDVNFGPSADVLYAFWPKNRGTRTYASEPFTIWVWPNRVNSTLDTFTFSSVAALTKEYDSDNIKAWPNPYFGYNPEEKSATDRQIHFTHLPETGKCIIRIFDLVGEFVRKIEHNNSTQFEIWDVRDFHSNPVASGMYIVHIETEQGEKILKLAVIQPQL
jgi:hypothetical protein